MTKTILITGATDGIGEETAKQLARQGAHVIVHGRSASKATAVCDSIRASGGTADTVIADFAALSQVRAMAQSILSRYPHLDVLINNAGLFMTQRRLSHDGYEMTFAVNHLAPFLLTNLLLDRLTHSAPARIINVSSMTHTSAHLDWDNLQGERRYDGYAAYSLSKLANVLFTYKLAAHLDPAYVTVNTLHPGVISTNLLHDGWGSGGAPVAQGADTPVYLALSEGVATITGKYFQNKAMRQTAPITHDVAAQDRLWQISAALTGLS